MNIDLSKQDLYTRDLIAAAFAHTKKLKMETKRQFDREASFFKKRCINMSPKIENGYLKQKDIHFIAGGDDRINHVVMVFTDKLFTTREQADKMCKKRLEAIRKHVKAEQSEEISFQILGLTANLDVSQGKTVNNFVACARFVSSVKIHNFCVVS